ncbi:hypothetical protein FGO68_gene13228 [Halteria grandinella]|uniref:Uncharacterized protein n=1 Tax=Halteria grandinella TaxID=5974 RepID=A0A8J8T8W4_HALGN|nr:hypothetical protein FGO68_gene13228 [Halteria grandinella]
MAAQNYLDNTRGQNTTKGPNSKGGKLSDQTKSPKSSGKRANEDPSKPRSNYKGLNRNLKDLARDLNCDDEDPTVQFYTTLGIQQQPMAANGFSMIQGQQAHNYNNRQINSPKNMEALRAAIGGAPQTQLASTSLGIYKTDSVAQSGMLQQPRRASLLTNKSNNSQMASSQGGDSRQPTSNNIIPNNYNIAATAITANKQQPFKISLQRAE